MELRLVRLSDPEVEPLLAGLTEEYAQRYGSSIGAAEMVKAGAEEFDEPNGAFVVFVDAGVTLAGAGIRRLTADTCEVKRMWTAPEHRRRGHARSVLRALEDAARRLGYRRVRLVTGPAQPEALALYRNSGYLPIPEFNSDWGALAFERDLTT